MELILLTTILILLLANLCVVLMKNNRKQTERLEMLFRQEMKENREEMNRNMRELRTELNQALNLSTQQMQTTLHRNLMTTNEMQREKFDAMGRQDGTAKMDVGKQGYGNITDFLAENRTFMCTIQCHAKSSCR